MSSLRTDAPEFLSPPLTQFDIIEGQSSAINLTARANPTPIEYKWSRLADAGTPTLPPNSSGLDGSRFAANGAILSIANVLRQDSGVYKLQASNELGTSETAVKVNVQCMSVAILGRNNSDSSQIRRKLSA